MSMKPFYIHHKEDEKGATGEQLVVLDLILEGRDDKWGAREHRGCSRGESKDMGLDPADFTFYTDGFRYGAPHAGWGLGVARSLMVLTGAGNVRKSSCSQRRSRVTPEMVL